VDQVDEILTQHGFNCQIVRQPEGFLRFGAFTRPERIDRVLLALGDAGYRYRVAGESDGASGLNWRPAAEMQCLSCGGDVVTQAFQDESLVLARLPAWVAEVGHGWLPLCPACFVRTLAETLGSVEA
jgi:hypothetical protein